MNSNRSYNIVLYLYYIILYYIMNTIRLYGLIYNILTRNFYSKVLNVTKINIRLSI